VRRPIIKIFVAVVVLTLVVAGGTAAWLWSEAQSFLAATPTSDHDERIIVIPRGTGPQSLSALLVEEGVVTDADRFAYFLRYREATPKLRAGEFRFWTDQTPDEVLSILLHAPEVTYSVTIPPGLRLREMGERVEAASRGTADEYVRLAEDADFIASLGLSIEPLPPNLEGLLVPETYSFGKDAGTEEVLRAQAARFNELWTPDRVARAAEIGLTPYEVTTLASVVEKETAAPTERPLIAGVFHNRLRKGMRLESDPTIIYGLQGYDGNIRRSDIRRPHPWNTYVITGLPPTPIAGPGVEAIDAVLHPDETRALFFVSRNDGTHHFSETYREHARMVDKYQRR